ncbi:very long chain fatty acid elongase AAEL008004-like [Dermacentor andersoni]|uniref:very long chain fatty acid elongase AAEL008004-like n=1 Tax=Dermacentor andersoni TaxID=34620 RepID=UPI0021559638|nr:elongation of very long chain fatty acids protein AAEL008004-like [Dermacentor andersoni]
MESQQANILGGTAAEGVPWLPLRDSRTEGWPLTGSPLPVAIITAAYVYFVKVAGPRWMSRRKPYDLRGCILVYNLLAALFSAFFVVRFAKLAYWDRGYSFLMGLDLSNDPASVEIVRLSWWLYMFKLSELTSTVFYVLRRKYDQVTTLHVVHHVIVAWNVWINVTYAAQSHTMFVVCINGFVHVLSYLYYFLSALGPAFKKWLWWKRYLTMVQIVQFVLYFVHAVGLIFATGNYVPLFVWLEFGQAVLFFSLFVLFYVNLYAKDKGGPCGPVRAD